MNISSTLLISDLLTPTLGVLSFIHKHGGAVVSCLTEFDSTAWLGLSVWSLHVVSGHSPKTCS